MKFQKIQKSCITVILIVLHILMMCGNTFSADLTVKLMLNLENTKIPVGSAPIALTAVTRGMNVQVTWKLIGPGQIEGTGIAAIYIVPEQIDEETTRAIIIVTAKDKTGQEAMDAVTFMIIPNPDTPSPSVDKPLPNDSSAKKGLSTSTKVALGAGAAAALGGGIVLATQGGKGDDPDPSLSGTWIGDIITEDQDTGEPLLMPLRLVLTQKENEITGNGRLVEIISIDLVTGTCTYPNISLTLHAVGYPPFYFQGTFSGENMVVGSVDGSGFTNDPLTLKRL
jgi:hypothetical protein